MEAQISQAITSGWFTKLQNHLISDVIIVGGGPSGLVCAAELASQNIKTTLIEKDLAPGGGMWGGAMFFNQIVFHKDALQLLERFAISYSYYGNDLYVCDAVEATSSLIYNATHKGAGIFTGICMEDVLVKDNRVSGVVINWSTVKKDRLHIDPLSLSAQAILDATGHPCEVVSVLCRKNTIHLNLPSETIPYEKSLNAEAGEKSCLEFTQEVYPGLFVSGMAACGVSGSNRMGPIFTSMLLSGMKAADLILKSLNREN